MMHLGQRRAEKSNEGQRRGSEGDGRRREGDGTRWKGPPRGRLAGALLALGAAPAKARLVEAILARAAVGDLEAHLCACTQRMHMSHVHVRVNGRVHRPCSGLGLGPGLGLGLGVSLGSGPGRERRTGCPCASVGATMRLSLTQMSAEAMRPSVEPCPSALYSPKRPPAAAPPSPSPSPDSSASLIAREPTALCSRGIVSMSSIPADGLAADGGSERTCRPHSDSSVPRAQWCTR